jgi:flagellar basal body rod protein FlgG
MKTKSNWSISFLSNTYKSIAKKIYIFQKIWKNLKFWCILLMNIDRRDNMDLSTIASTSGMKTAFDLQNATSQNIANINTENYAPKQPLQTEVFPVGTKISNVRENNTENDLSKELTDLNNNKNIYTMNAKALKIQDRMLGELIDLVG